MWSGSTSPRGRRPRHRWQRLQRDQHVPGGDGVADGHGQRGDGARRRGRDDVFHLQRLQDHQRGPGAHGVALLGLDRDDRSRAERAHRRRVVGQRDRPGAGVGDRRDLLDVAVRAGGGQDLGQVPVEEAGVQLACGERRVRDDPGQHVEVGVDAGDVALRQRPVRAGGQHGQVR
jgi:hypothetical protein